MLKRLWALIIHVLVHEASVSCREGQVEKSSPSTERVSLREVCHCPYTLLQSSGLEIFLDKREAVKQSLLSSQSNWFYFEKRVKKFNE